MDSETWAVIGPLYDERHDSLVRQAIRFVGSDAEDVVHEAFVRIARAVESGATSADADNMLTQTVKNLALNYIRDHAQEVAMEPHRVIDRIERPRAVSAESGLWTSTFNATLEAMADGPRAAFILVELRGLSQREAAELLDVNQATISRHYELARRTLARELQ